MRTTTTIALIVSAIFAFDAIDSIPSGVLDKNLRIAAIVLISVIVLGIYISHMRSQLRIQPR